MLRATITILALLTSLTAAAGNFDYLPSSQPSEKKFQQLMTSGNFSEALKTWASTHQSSSFALTQDGKATLAYLLLQNGMPIAGLEMLLLDTQPSKLSSELLQLWTLELKNSVWIQKGWVQTSGKWKNIYNNEQVRLSLKSSQDIARAFQRASKLAKDHTNQKARIYWQIATQAPQIGQVDQALRALKLLRESGQTVIGQDLISSTYARVLYQKGDMTAAMAEFQKIPKGSSLWIESVEERAWGYLKQDDYDRATGETVTLLSPALAPLVGPESYYLANLSALCVCDYPRIFKNSELFKKRHKSRLEALQELAKKGTGTHLSAALERFDKNGVSIESAGPLVEWIPRASLRDRHFVRHSELRKQLLIESAKANALLQSEGFSQSRTILRIASSSAKLADRMRQLAVQRLSTLARLELQEYRKIIDKMHIVEGEVIHRLAVDDSLKGERSKLAKVEDQGDVLVFPYSGDEVWFDELDNYKARVKDCPTLKGAGL